MSSHEFYDIFPLQLMSHSNSIGSVCSVSYKLSSSNLFDLVSMKEIIILLLNSYFIGLHII